MRADLVRYNEAKQISSALAYMEHEDPSGGIFASTSIIELRRNQLPKKDNHHAYLLKDRKIYKKTHYV